MPSTHQSKKYLHLLDLRMEQLIIKLYQTPILWVFGNVSLTAGLNEVISLSNLGLIFIEPPLSSNTFMSLRKMNWKSIFLSRIPSRRHYDYLLKLRLLIYMSTSILLVRVSNLIEQNNSLSVHHVAPAKYELLKHSLKERTRKREV